MKKTMKKVEVILVPTENRAYISKDDGTVRFTKFPEIVQRTKTNFYFYVVDDSEINYGDWFIRIFDNTITKANSQSDHKKYKCKKIIACDKVTIYNFTPTRFCF